MKRRLLSALFVLVVAGGLVGAYLYTQSRGNAPKYRTSAVTRGPITSAVSATGNLNAVITVQVGSQVSGQIKELFADFNLQVKRDQLIARIDPSTFCWFRFGCGVRQDVGRQWRRSLDRDDLG